MTLLYLARHAQQEAAQDEDPSVGLSATGRRQAQLLGDRLRDIRLDGIHHSPLLRARQTAHLVAERLPDSPVHSTPLLTDRTPVPVPGTEADYPAGHHAWLAKTPEAERDEGGAAISAAIDHFSRLHRRPPQSGDDDDDDAGHLLITHAFVIGWFVRDAMDAPNWRWLGLNPSNAGLTVIDYVADRPPRLISFNDVGHLVS